MTVLTPLFLAGLAALAIPILLHLLRRRERRTLVFPALRYLKQTTREHARIIRLRQLLLLALRLAAILLIALAGARLVLPLGGNDNPPAGLAIILDNGLTSGAVVGGSRVLDSLVVRALQALDQAGTRDQVWVIPTGTPLQPSVPLSPEAARISLRALTPTHVTPNLSAALVRAGSLLDAAAPELHETVVVSDLMQNALPPPEPGAIPRSDRVVVAPPPRSSPANRGIGEFLVSGGLIPRAGDLAEVEVTVVGTDVAGATVRGYLDGRLVGTVGVSSDGTAVVPLPRLAAGWVRGRVEVEPDGLRGDDAMYFTFQAFPPPTVRVRGSIAPFLEEALSVLDEAGRIELVADGDALVQVMGAATLGEPAPRGTVILVPPDEAALLPSLNQELARLLPGWALEAQPIATGSELTVDGGLLFEFLPSPPNVRHAYRIRTEGPEDERAQLLNLSNGEPWIVETETSSGSVIVMASPLTVEASDLPGSAAMLPLIELLATRAADRMPESQQRAGEPFPLPTGSATVRRPDGTARYVAGLASFRETELAGVYEVLDSDEQILTLVAVNPMSPSSAMGLSAADAVSRISEQWEEARVGEPWPQSVLRDRRGREVARSLLVALLLLLVAESWLASVDPRNTEQSEKLQDGRTNVGAGIAETSVDE